MYTCHAVLRFLTFFIDNSDVLDKDEINGRGEGGGGGVMGEIRITTPTKHDMEIEITDIADLIY